MLCNIFIVAKHSEATQKLFFMGLCGGLEERGIRSSLLILDLKDGKL